MRVRLSQPHWFVALGSLLVAPVAVFANPDGAPWGAADPEAAENCSTCHFDSAAVRESPQLQLHGLPKALEPGRTYFLRVAVSGYQQGVAGFQLIATARDSAAGEFSSECDNLEAIGGAIRSTAPKTLANSAVWQFKWLSPDEPGHVVRFYLASVMANDDRSPFGDQVHFFMRQAIVQELKP